MMVGIIRMGIGSSICNYCGSSIVEDTLHATMRYDPIGMSLWLNVVPIISRDNFLLET